MKVQGCFLLACLCWFSPAAQAGLPGLSLFTSSQQRVPADPNADYSLRDEHGPWLIMCTTFTGERAQQQAHDLVLELRQRYKLEAFTHSRTFDYTGTEQGRGVDKFGDPKVMRYLKSERINEVAVLAGQFASIEDPLAQKTLAQLKQFKPECLEKKGDQPVQTEDGVSLAAFRARIRQAATQVLKDPSTGKKHAFVNKKKGLGRLANAFLVPNPLLPADFFRQQIVDELVLKMNSQVEHSLFDCPGRYTMVVATFKGFASVDQQQIKDYEEGDSRVRMPSRLEQAAEDAQRMTQALIEKGYEAYQFHDRTSSIVCVGSFETIGNQRPDGTYDFHPQIMQIMKTFGAEQQIQPGHAVPTFSKPKKVAGITCDLMPAPKEVPRRWKR